jgi:hypothetical protein
MGVVVIVGYRPLEGKQEQLLEEMKQHVPILVAEGLATNQKSFIMQAKDGVIIEVFEWLSQDAIVQAHNNPVVGAMWGRYAECCTFETLEHLPEWKDLFPGFEAVHFD